MTDPVPAAALAAWFDALSAAGALPAPVTHDVDLADAVGRVTAGPLVARWDSPAHACAAMDGIAVLAADTAASSRLTSFDVVDTGDAVPPGRDAVVRHEQVVLEGGTAVLDGPVQPGTDVRQVGEDVRAGQPLLPAGHRLRPVDVAWLAAAGHTVVAVRRRPHVVVVPTGDEVRPLGSVPGPGQVLDTNSLMLVALAVEAGCTAVSTGVVPDDPAALTAAVRAAARTADLVVVGAGSSSGRDDHTAAVVASAGTLVVHGVAVRPGHPVALGFVDATAVLGAPGYPVATALAFDLLAAPLLARLAGMSLPARPRVLARLADPLTSPAGVEDWVRVVLAEGVATPLPGGAGVLGSLARADALLRVPAGTTVLPAGASVEVELLGRT